ncbi:MAG TPA: MBL fold metallo-hydrolase [Candidatus Acetatifactor stercoripullorum]|uniref:MBL fold metallo-hydrolase n=1 Tax=Candidatus Acetatifactor stercoripullorum TaxID=2838414 RepID=A0A9D1UBK3_9FIRM|nr:MBL fold metallo-hydrolase [Candidatus Acetatifactor stercoripullorum]HIW80611.1 MBL fold metallo-hydrolase [Candidatus Acetatifactor stercoripullorum]
MRLCSIASGSSGNCIYVGSEATHLLVDVGISGKRTECGLHTLGITGADLDGILVTHEHMDHINGLGVMARKYNVPIYATKGTIEAIKECTTIGRIEDSLFREVYEDEKLIIKDLTVNPMRISHDAAQPVAYRIGYGSKRVGICTDLGVYNDYTVECLKGMDAVLLEANHDVNMLQVGPYPYYLKQRILGDKGHLSNENSGRLLGRILHDGLQTILLGHLSKENNLPELAYEAVRMEITMGDNPYNGGDFRLMVAGRNEVSPIINIA